MTSRLMEGPQWDLSEQAVSDYDPCAGRLAVKTEARATLRDVRRLAPSVNVNSQWVATQDSVFIALVRTSCATSAVAFM